MPIYRQKTHSTRRRSSTGSIGLGDFIDVTYSVLLTVGRNSMPVVLDTGSADLWVLSDACTTCPGDVALYRQATFQSVDLDVRLLYGDSRTGTHASGLIGRDEVGIAGFTLEDQYFAAINNTNTSVEETDSAGIFGLGFPVNSVIWSIAFRNQRTSSGTTKHEIKNSNNSNRKRLDFPDLSSLYPRSTRPARQLSSSTVPAVFHSYPTIAPLLARLVVTNALSFPLFTIALQRDTVEVGGNVGLLSIGALPNWMKNESVTWVPVRMYTKEQGGLPPPPDSPNEQYPIAWEVFVDDVFLDGEKLPRSTLSPPSIALSALIDTGNSLLRGPADVVQAIFSKLGPRIPCSEPHTLAFQIGGKQFPVDPRDFVNQAYTSSVDECKPNLVQTDPPKVGKYLYSWSLGDPFLKSVISSFYYGNLTYPSQDPPRMGFLSTVPSDADDRMRAAVRTASHRDGTFPAVSETAPAGPPSSSQTNAEGVPEANPTGAVDPFQSNPARQPRTSWVWLLAVGLTSFLMI